MIQLRNIHTMKISGYTVNTYTLHIHTYTRTHMDTMNKQNTVIGTTYIYIHTATCRSFTSILSRFIALSMSTKASKQVMVYIMSEWACGNAKNEEKLL